MKKVANIISIIFILLLFYLTNDKDILTLTISFSIYNLFGSVFSTISIKNNNHKIFKSSILAILFLGIPLIIVSYLIGDILDINKLNIINTFMILSLLSNAILKITSNYIECLGYKKLGRNLIDIYNIITISIKMILTVLLFGIFNVPSYISILSLYWVDIMIAILLWIVIYFRIIKNNNLKKNEKVNYINETKKVLVGNKIEILYKLINSAYIYVSIIVLYFVLTNRYNYTYNSVSTYITNTYFYGIIIIYYIHKIIKNKLSINFKDDFINNSNKVIKILLMITILMSIISKPLSYLLFKSEYNILVNILPLLFTYTLYDFTISTNMIYNKDKNIIITLIIGIIIKSLFEIPLINTIYRMGYTLTLGSILSIVLGLTISVTVGIILIKKKLKLNLLENFNTLLNIIYESLIYTFIMVLLTLIVKIDTHTVVDSILVIIFYIFITITLNIIRKKQR